MGFSIQECAEVYDALRGSTYRLTLENEATLDIRFEREGFKHLLGLHKIKDVRGLSDVSAIKVYKDILDGASIVKAIQKSAQYKLIEERVSRFYYLPTLLHGKIVINFDIRLLNGESHLTNTDYILYRKVRGGYVHLTIGENLRSYYPETFFFEPSKRYISDQTLLDITSAKIVSNE